METVMTSRTIPVKLKKRVLEIMKKERCSLVSAEQQLLVELLREIK